MRRFNSASLVTLVCASLLGGCGFVHRHFGHDNDEVYKQAPNERPLEVPPDLDKPTGTASLSIPPAPGGTSPSTSSEGTATSEGASADGAAPDTGAGDAAAAPIANGASVALSGAGLQVIDNLDSTWSRVGLALEHSGAAKVLDRDESAHVYTVQTTGRATVKKKAGLFKRIITFGRAGKQTTGQVQLRVRVAADGDNSRVSIEGADTEVSRDAARALLQTIRDRMS